ncbi:MAG: hypothetical protein R3362_11730 [Rhodothermales bacterium]|nr:hypothetical protein [Rhodothermales bacterium]
MCHHLLLLALPAFALGCAGTERAAEPDIATAADVAGYLSAQGYPVMAAAVPPRLITLNAFVGVEVSAYLVSGSLLYVYEFDTVEEAEYGARRTAAGVEDQRVRYAVFQRDRLVAAYRDGPSAVEAALALALRPRLGGPIGPRASL